MIYNMNLLDYYVLITKWHNFDGDILFCTHLCCVKIFTSKIVLSEKILINRWESKVDISQTRLFVFFYK